MTDFWPEGISIADSQSPKGILMAADEQWRTKSDGVFSLDIQEATSTKGHTMLIVHARHEPTNRTVKLFKVVHRATAPYPVTIQPREEDLPNFLKKSYFAPSFTSSFTTMGDFAHAMRTMSEGRMVENEWVADTPGEFRDQLKGAFNLGIVKASILALVAEGDDSTERESESPPGTGGSTPSAGESPEGDGESSEGARE